MDDEQRGGFLPPVPAGPEPELGRQPAPSQLGQAYTPPGGQPPPGAWEPPAGPGRQAGPQPWAYPQAVVPDNNQAVAGFVLSLVSLGLLVISAGLSTIVSAGCAIAGMILGRKGVRKVEAGQTPKHKGLGQAGFWIGLTSLILSLIATAAWIAILVAAISDDDFRDDLEQEFDQSRTLSTIAVAGVRAGVHLLA